MLNTWSKYSLCVIAVCAYINLELAVDDLREMWLSPSNIPINISLTSIGDIINARSLGDKRTIPLVERAADNIGLGLKNNK
jgi:hypothetical protein